MATKATKTVKTYQGEIITITKTSKQYIHIPSTYNLMSKWVWTAEDGTEWTPMCGEWRKVVDHKHWRSGSVLGKEASDWYYDRAYNVSE